MTPASWYRSLGRSRILFSSTRLFCAVASRCSPLTGRTPQGRRRAPRARAGTGRGRSARGSGTGVHSRDTAGVAGSRRCALGPLTAPPGTVPRGTTRRRASRRRWPRGAGISQPRRRLLRPRLARLAPVAGAPGLLLQRLEQATPSRLAGVVVGGAGRHLAPQLVEQRKGARPLARGGLGVWIVEEGQPDETLARPIRVEEPRPDYRVEPDADTREKSPAGPRCGSLWEPHLAGSDRRMAAHAPIGHESTTTTALLHATHDRAPSSGTGSRRRGTANRHRCAAPRQRS